MIMRLSVRHLFLIVTAMLPGFAAALAAFAFALAANPPPGGSVDGLRHAALSLRGQYRSLPIYAPDNSGSNSSVLLSGDGKRGLVSAAYAGPDQRRPSLRQNLLVLSGVYTQGAAIGAFAEGDTEVIGNRLIVDDPQAIVCQARGANAPTLALAGAVGLVARENLLLLREGWVDGDAAGGYGRQSASANSVTVHGGAVSGRVYGGMAAGGDAVSNIVIMTGGRVERELVGGDCVREGRASGNTVALAGGAVGGISGGRSGNAPAEGNVILVSGGAIHAPRPESDGPRAEFAAVCGGRSLQGDAVNNRIFLSGKPRLDKCVFWGGFAEAPPSPDARRAPDVVSGNSLTLRTDYQGVFPEARNFERFSVSGPDTILPEAGYRLHPSVGRFSHQGLLRFSGKRPAGLHFIATRYASDQGGIGIYIHNEKQRLGADLVVLDSGELLLAPLRLKLMNPEDLPLATPLPVAAIAKAQDMVEVNRRKAVQWLERPRLSGAEAGRCAIDLYPLLGPEGQDIWHVEKLPIPPKGK
jgi:hypothetical protein